MDRMAGEQRTLEDFFEVRVLEPGREVQVAGLRVRCRFGAHSVPALGFLIDDGAWTLGWSGDTSFVRAHVEWLAEADVIVHECNVGPVHTSIESLNALPSGLRSKLRLIHLPDDFDRGSTDIAILEAGMVLAD